VWIPFCTTVIHNTSWFPSRCWGARDTKFLRCRSYWRPRTDQVVVQRATRHKTALLRRRAWVTIQRASSAVFYALASLPVNQRSHSLNVPFSVSMLHLQLILNFLRKWWRRIFRRPETLHTRSGLHCWRTALPSWLCSSQFNLSPTKYRVFLHSRPTKTQI